MTGLPEQIQISIDEDDRGAARGYNHEDQEDNTDDNNIYNDNRCDLFNFSMATKTMITLKLFHIAVEDDGDGDDGNDDDIDNTKNNSNDNNYLSGGGTLSLPPNRPTQGGEHHGSSDHKKDGAWEQNKIIVNVNHS